MKYVFFLLFVVTFSTQICSAKNNDEAVKEAAVKIFTVYNEYDYYRPWQMRGKMSKTGSGCIIEGKRILTNAHVVADQTFIQVKRAGQAEKFIARVEYVGHECDLAVLRVADDRFFEHTTPIKVGTLPLIRDKVAVYGFPRGGTKIAITEGVVSRIENQYFSHSQANLLACQIDAPINSGSSGGPVISEGKIAGVAFQSASGENIGYMVPAPVVKHFLTDISDGAFDGFPTLGISFQKMENPDIRNKYAMSAHHSGVLVSMVHPESPLKGVVSRGDIILSIESFDIANDATISFRKNDRTFFEYAVQDLQIGDTGTMTLLRDSKEHSVSFANTLSVSDGHLVPRQQFDTPPRYFITGGFVFVPLTRNFLTTWGPRSWVRKAPKHLVHHYFSEPDTSRDEIIILAQILSDEVNVGYDDFVFSVINEVNGVKIRNLDDLITAVDSNENPFQKITDDEGYTIIYSTQKAKEAKPRIFNRYRLVFDRYQDK